MIPDADGNHAVILARGASTRMGAPKGLVCLPGDEVTLVERIVDLYAGFGIPATVVTLPALAEPYRTVLSARKNLRVVGAVAGGDTARTLLVGWRSFGDDDVPVRRIWAHPVDLPLVTSASLATLAAVGREHPGRIVRPVYRDHPGHPVLVPAAVLEILAANPEWIDATLQAFFARGDKAGWFRAVVTVSVPDPGVVRDFDSPEDLRLYEGNEDP